MINCYIIDDERHAIDTLIGYIEENPILTLLGFTTDPDEGLQFLTSRNVDITFLDIEMPGLSGLQLASLVGSITKIVFTTAHQTFAFDAFEINAFDFLLKPVSKSRFLRSILKYKTLHSENYNTNDYFYIKGDAKGKISRINTDEINYIEGALNYILIHFMDGRKESTYLTLAEIENVLPNSFTRIHRSYIVNDKKIKSIIGCEINLNEKTKLHVGRAYKEQLLEKLSTQLVKTKRF